LISDDSDDRVGLGATPSKRKGKGIIHSLKLRKVKVLKSVGFAMSGALDNINTSPESQQGDISLKDEQAIFKEDIELAM
jgi:hypothetical protein